MGLHDLILPFQDVIPGKISAPRAQAGELLFDLGKASNLLDE